MDIVSSKGQWVDQECVYDQNPLSGIGYNAADILIDVVCSGLSILYSWEFLSSDFTRIGEVIVGENGKYILNIVIIIYCGSLAIFGDTQCKFI
ncbi:hypothetical protein BCR33DRAFT_716438 [Rhizoclosmatium globosum]|uniref:Uncharacterized protein n=1 Tax=Rhizoclosmatium globosum TaxID=329046 RepID=A0A1Y2CDX9_9FUNG|nr:hypothetical protein BCR33DRAFT_716438 [Rhizoclosmatium globosum]|eukprot:ORY45097.1 hypothetical protein BCR33DRAFT_716438 [Rhizoclosmatium globosum]